MVVWHNEWPYDYREDSTKPIWLILANTVISEISVKGSVYLICLGSWHRFSWSAVWAHICINCSNVLWLKWLTACSSYNTYANHIAACMLSLQEVLTTCYAKFGLQWYFEMNWNTIFNKVAHTNPDRQKVIHMSPSWSLHRGAQHLCLEQQCSIVSYNPSFQLWVKEVQFLFIYLYLLRDRPIKRAFFTILTP